MADSEIHAPTGPRYGSMDKIAKDFKLTYRTFSNQHNKNIVLFVRNVDKNMGYHLVPSSEMGMAVIACLKGEPHNRAKRWIEVEDLFWSQKWN